MIPGQFMATAMQNVWVRYVVILMTGITIGAVFYPTKTLKETISKQYEQQIQTLNEQHTQTIQSMTNLYQDEQVTTRQEEEQYNAKIDSLTTQVSDLQSHKTLQTYKIVHPDGTIEERTSSESDVDQSSSISTQVQAEYQQKLQEQATQLNVVNQQQISTLQQQFDQKETSYKQQIATLQETKTVTVNPKNFGVEAGVLSNRDYYGHITYDIWGPMFLGLHTEIGPIDNNVGVGIGIKF
jgi:hypothetical protein